MRLAGGVLPVHQNKSATAKLSAQLLNTIFYSLLEYYSTG